MMRRVPDLTKINKLIDFKPKVDLDTTIRRVHESHR